MPDVAFFWNKNNPSILDSYNAGKFEFNFPEKLRIIKRYIVYMSIYLVIFFSIGYFLISKSNLLLIFAILNLILFFIGLIFPYKADLKQNSNEYTFTLKEKIIIYMKIICISSSSGFSLLISIGLIAFLTLKNPLPHEYINNGTCIFFISLVVVCASAICLFAPQDESISHKTWMLGFATVFIAVICFLNNFSPISSNIMAELKLGDIISTLEIDNVACQAFSWAHYPIKCSPKKQYYFVDNVNLKWRSGEYYITFKSGTQTNELLIPQVHILAVLNPQKNDKIDKKALGL